MASASAVVVQRQPTIPIRRGALRFSVGWVILAALLRWSFKGLSWLVWRPVRDRLLTRVFRYWVYQPKWRTVLEFCDLHHLRTDGTQAYPQLGKVHSSEHLDRVRVTMLTGQVIGDWAAESERFKTTYGALDCRVSAVPKRPHDVELSFMRKDPLNYEIEPYEGESDLASLEVAKQEDGDWYNLPLLGQHLLVVGATNSGKSDVLWAVIDRLKSYIHAGLAQIWALDPKGGAELAFGAPVFHRFCFGDDDENAGMGKYEMAFALVLEEAVAVMRRRQKDQRGVARVHTPTVAEPLIVLIVDEIAALTSYVGNSEAKKRIANALNLLLSQGRAFGITILGAIQDARKETLPSRSLFPARVMLRCAEEAEVALVFTQTAHDLGAKADKIPYGLPGVGFVQLDGRTEAVRVRFVHMTDERIHDMVAYARPNLRLVA